MTLLIWGAGGHGKVVLDVARGYGRFREIAFIDDMCSTTGQKFCGAPLVGNSTALESELRKRFTHFLVAIGSNDARARCYYRAAAAGLKAAVIVHPMATVSSSAHIEPGTVVLAQCVVNADAWVGENCIINSGSVVEHDCRLGNHVHVSPNATLGGGAVVDEYSQVGLGAVVLPGAQIGAHSIVGAGAVVLRNVSAWTTVVGVPARGIASHVRTSRE